MKPPTNIIQGNYNHYDGRRFFNPWDPSNRTLWDLIRWRFTRKAGKWPRAMEVTPLDVGPLGLPKTGARLSFIGHASWLIELPHMRILCDPIWSNNPSPIPWVNFMGLGRVTPPGLLMEKLPPIDAVLISHSHYDHLDLPTLQAIEKRQKGCLPRLIAPVGNQWLRKKFRQMPLDLMNWGDRLELSPDVSLHFEPAQHWASRMPWDKNKSLWGSYVIKNGAQTLVFVGDSAYHPFVFENLRKKYSPIDVSILPIGAYLPRWFMHTAHMSPDESVQAHVDLGSKFSLASHFDCFPLDDNDYGAARADLYSALVQRGLTDADFKALHPSEFVYKP